MTYRDLLIADGAMSYWRMNDPVSHLATGHEDLHGYSSGMYQRGTPPPRGLVAGVFPGNSATSFHAVGSSGGALGMQIGVSPGTVFDPRNGPWAIEGFIKRDVITPTANWGVGVIASVNGHEIKIGPVTNTGIQVLFGSGGTPMDVTLAASLSGVDWFHVILSCTGPSGTIQLFNNGLLSDTKSTTAYTQGIGTLWLGEYDSVGGAWESILDDFSFYHNSLTPTQAWAHYLESGLYVPHPINGNGNFTYEAYPVVDPHPDYTDGNDLFTYYATMPVPPVSKRKFLFMEPIEVKATKTITQIDLGDVS